MDRVAHWQAVYGAHDDAQLTWFEEEAALSQELIRHYAGPGNAVLDAGGGAARLVDGLLAQGFDDVTVLDVSEAALEVSRTRLGAAAAQVNWVVADITGWQPPRAYDLWHDRAVFHFLTDPADRAAYVRALVDGLTPGGVAIIASFAPDGPETCSGLPVCRYSAETLVAELEARAPGVFALEEAVSHIHRTPAARAQSFQLSVLRRR